MNILEHATAQAANLSANQHIIRQQFVDPASVCFRVVFQDDHVKLDFRQSSQNFNLGAFGVQFQDLRLRQDARRLCCNFDKLGTLLTEIEKTALAAVVKSQPQAR